MLLVSSEGSGTIMFGGISFRLKYPSVGLSSSLKDSPSSESSALYKLSEKGISDAEDCGLSDFTIVRTMNA